MAKAASRTTATRVTCGAISLSSSSHFPLTADSNPADGRFEQGKASSVAARACQTVDEAGADRIGDVHEHDRHRARRLQQRPDGCGGNGQDDVRRQRHQFGRVFANTLGIPGAPAILDPHVASIGPAQLLQTLHERRQPARCFRIVRGQAHQHGDATHPLGLLRMRSERPCSRRAAEQRDERAPLHSITSSARASSVGLIR